MILGDPAAASGDQPADIDYGLLGDFQKIKPHPSRIFFGLEFRLQAALGGLDT